MKIFILLSLLFNLLTITGFASECGTFFNDSLKVDQQARYDKYFNQVKDFLGFEVSEIEAVRQVGLTFMSEEVTKQIIKFDAYGAQVFRTEETFYSGIRVSILNPNLVGAESKNVMFIETDSKILGVGNIGVSFEFNDHLSINNLNSPHREDLVDRALRLKAALDGGAKDLAIKFEYEEIGDYLTSSHHFSFFDNTSEAIRTNQRGMDITSINPSTSEMSTFRFIKIDNKVVELQLIINNPPANEATLVRMLNIKVAKDYK